MRRLLLALFVAGAALAQDPEFVRMWEEAQQQRPRSVASDARIAPPNEPGTPLVVHGRLFQRNGATPVAGVIVFAYQTDRTGVYNRNNVRGWRLRGWARTDAEGRFTFRTIRPGTYPNRSAPAHIHLSIQGPGMPRRWTNEVQFADDALHTPRARRESEAAGAFGSIRPVTTRGGVQHVEFHLRLEETGLF
ncbi:MAG TPA: hypothetical protein VNA69_05005 [Thermoanaerobaculia bacterium]|nr:hypothetical protein [Thermoanaerobaculia bacterium]